MHSLQLGRHEVYLGYHPSVHTSTVSFPHRHNFEKNQTTKYTVCMYSNIKQLRRNGIRFKREGEAGLGVFGEVMLVHHNGYPCLKAQRFGDASQDSQILAPLHRAVCVNFQRNILRFEGFQVEKEGAPAYVQEWLITIISDRPPREVEAAQRADYASHGA